MSAESYLKYICFFYRHKKYLSNYDLRQKCIKYLLERVLKITSKQKELLSKILLKLSQQEWQYILNFLWYEEEKLELFLLNIIKKRKIRLRKKLLQIINCEEGIAWKTSLKKF
jgi:hypothetical protein